MTPSEHLGFLAAAERVLTEADKRLHYHELNRLALEKGPQGTKSASLQRDAAPVTLIDGERLLDLLTEHELGVRKKKAELWELETDDFTGLLPDEEEDEDA
jgi:restriction endonuclease Mrr